MSDISEKNKVGSSCPKRFHPDVAVHLRECFFQGWAAFDNLDWESVSRFLNRPEENDKEAFLKGWSANYRSKFGGTDG